MKKRLLFTLGLLSFGDAYHAVAQVATLTEGFDGAAIPTGWTTINRSTTAITGNPWQVGVATAFTPYSGAGNALTNYTATGSNGTNATISNWLITPNLLLVDGATITFYTRTPDASAFADRLEVRASTTGNTVATGVNTVSGFTNLLCSINPNLQVGTSAGGCGNLFPQTWTQYTITVSGVGTTGISGYLAFRYYVTNGGTNGANSNLIALDNFTYSASFPLVLSLTDFKGVALGNENFLSWTTATEINNTNGFELQRSANGMSFITIAKIPTKSSDGTSNFALSYDYKDPNPLSGNNFYRLKQASSDGKASFSPTVTIRQNQGNELTLSYLYPNPAINELNLIVNSPEKDNLHFSIADISGRAVLKEDILVASGSVQHSINISVLPAGVYVIKVTGDNAKQDVVQRFTKQ